MPVSPCQKGFRACDHRWDWSVVARDEKGKRYGRRVGNRRECIKYYSEDDDEKKSERNRGTVKVLNWIIVYYILVFVRMRESN